MSTNNFQNQAYESIKNAILSAELVPGTRISEKEFEEQLKMGRTPIREAIIRLRREELVRVIPQSGTYVAKINIQQIEEARFVRETLEKSIFVLACDLATEEHYQALEKLLVLQKTYASLKDETNFFQLDEEFHHLVYQIANKNHVWNWLQSINLQLNRFRFLRLEVAGLSWEVILTDHEEILQALKERNKDKVAKLVGTHIDVIDNDLKVVTQAFPDYFED
ncbi:GntR family transcriptional regulator [Enterococcus sp. JM4C]|uniref:GntR family transcriptional regulator n=1 Tax=Candidatus Enterococcus huntleyi TaxID=1857217 RepID=UPI00137ACE2E|nr:GntR family transcriptional regulator [Enterococcus sp. JM4C]KAF1296655.1 GntR family transcriptional regulator [Enterococcus sp. JM4C]